jgi:hypothetical protein
MVIVSRLNVMLILRKMMSLMRRKNLRRRRMIVIESDDEHGEHEDQFSDPLFQAWVQSAP